MPGSKNCKKRKSTYFYYVEDVMEITGYQHTMAYAVIKKLNDELAQQGQTTFPGRIPKKYFKQKFCCDNLE